MPTSLLPCIGQALHTIEAVIIVGSFLVLALVVICASFEALRNEWRAK